ncbi:MAG: hypothetical protein KKB51_00535 [Candidatus Riflebacteria bacterium]|nr:hypothetical protein [Candidatus Riflebacteria bacterium]
MQPLSGQTSNSMIDESRLIIFDNSFRLEIVEDSGKTIKHNEAWEITFPQKFKNRKLNFVRLHFCKDPRFLELNDKKLDENGAYLSLSCHNAEDNSWNTWSDQFGSEKFATVGSKQKLNRNIFNAIQSLIGSFTIDRIRLKNSGRGRTELAVAQVHYLECFFLEEMPSAQTFDRTFKAEAAGANKVTFDLKNETGTPFFQGEKWSFALPPSIAGRQINYIVLKFRQSPDKIASETFQDIDPAYILVQAHDRNTGLLWPWYDRYGSEKYVEPRTVDDPETEGLHDCLSCMKDVQTDKIVLTHAGYGDRNKSAAIIHSLEVIVFPDKANTYSQELIFTELTKFAKPDAGIDLPESGGGPRFGGKYPGALMLGVRRHFRRLYLNSIPHIHRFFTSEPAVSNGYIDSLGRLVLNLPAGKKLRQVEVAAGDIDNTVLSMNKDKHFGRLGWSELYAYVRSGQDGKLRLIAAKANVGPEGVIAFSPDVGDLDILPGDQLIIESRLDVAFIMGLRFLFVNPRQISF